MKKKIDLEKNMKLSEILSDIELGSIVTTVPLKYEKSEYMFNNSELDYLNNCYNVWLKKKNVDLKNAKFDDVDMLINGASAANKFTKRYNTIFTLGRDSLFIGFLFDMSDGFYNTHDVVPILHNKRNFSNDNLYGKILLLQNKLDSRFVNSFYKNILQKSGISIFDQKSKKKVDCLVVEPMYKDNRFTTTGNNIDSLKPFFRENNNVYTGNEIHNNDILDGLNFIKTKGFEIFESKYMK